LQGDGSDNIPGVYGVGESTATKLLNKFPNMITLYSDIESGKYTGKIAERIKEFGYERLTNNYKVMNLSLDRVGARYALSEELKFYRKADKKFVKNYFLRSAFISLLDSLPMLVSNLEIPRFDPTMRYPIIACERKPLEDI
jgi:5'-3' exonuclease